MKTEVISYIHIVTMVTIKVINGNSQINMLNL